MTQAMSDAMDARTILIHGAGTPIGAAVAEEFDRRGMIVALHDAGRPAAAAAIARALAQGGRALDLSALPLDRGDIEGNLAAIAKRCGRLDALVNLYAPNRAADPVDLQSYVLDLYRRNVAAASAIALHTNDGMIVNQFFLASAFADTELADCMAVARGAIASFTRILAIQHGRLGVRVNGLLVGLLDIPEIKALASERVLAAAPPLRRWAEPVDVAKCIAFLVLDSGYITGQLLVMDGGLTGGAHGF
ncbi:MAG: SDR family oxidoreductase [Candidatus Competibacter sp.]|nr:SDR family oxidoreductase [Candidatus Competibacter sp.]